MLPVQSWEEATGSQQHGPFREDRPSVVDPLKVVLSDGRHANGSCWTVQELVTVSTGAEMRTLAPSLNNDLYENRARYA